MNATKVATCLGARPVKRFKEDKEMGLQLQGIHIGGRREEGKGVVCVRREGGRGGDNVMGFVVEAIEEAFRLLV